MSDQITARIGIERRERLYRAVDQLNAADPLLKTNATTIINRGIDKILDEIEAQLAAKKSD